MTLEDKVHGLRLQVIQRAEQLGNVSRACREAGISRALFYRWRRRLERYGQDGVHPRRHRARPGRPVQLAPETERLLLSVAVSAATWGASRIAAYLQHRWQVRVAPSTVQRALRRAGLATRRQRLTVLEHRALQTAGLLTERTRRALGHAQHGELRHVAAREPGEVVCVDTFYIGQLKGVGKVCRSRPAMPRAPMAWRGCCRPTTPRRSLTSCVGSWCRCIAGRAGGCAACSPTAAPSSRAPSMTPVGRSASATRGRSRGMRGRMGSSSGCKARSCRSIGAWPSVGATSRVERLSNEASMVSCSPTITSGRIRATGSAAAPQPRSSGAPLGPDRMSHSGMAKVSTPFRVWTP
jgi:transposase